MEKYTLPPRATSLSESMRDIGYSLETAIADIIDNSIAANATRIDIWIDFNTGQPRLGVTDNGSGLNRQELLEAMRHGSAHPRTLRARDDLGRFGLGLKTASFSQCRQLTVISRKNGESVGAVWDLDTISEDDEWVLGILNLEEIQSSPYMDKLGKQGTLVLWQKLDRLCEGESTAIKQDMLYEKMEATEKHLALVFHPYLSGEVRNRKLEVHINGHPLVPFDPFCLNNKATQLLPEEIIRMAGEEIRIQPYILPHHSKLTPKEHDYYQSRSEFVSNQGVYVYRNNRLMAWGSWFRLVPKSEATKLARVRIDFPNALDEHWTIDIKKSRAHPPYQVKEKLRQIINRIVEQSTRVHSGRGRRLFDEAPDPFWLKHADRDGIRYSLNSDHPVLTAFKQILEDDEQRLFQEVLSVIEESIPVEAIYADYSIAPKSFDAARQMVPEEVRSRLLMLYQILSAEQQLDENTFRETVNQLKPFNNYPQEIEWVIREKFLCTT